MRDIEPSATLAINERFKELRSEGRDMIGLHFGQSPFPPPESVLHALQENAHQNAYLPSKGLKELREILAEKYRNILARDQSPDDVLIGTGSKELMFLLQLAENRELITPTPTWVSYTPQARILDRPTHTIDTSANFRWLLTPAKLEEFAHVHPNIPGLLALNYPSNPTGTTFADTELRDIAEISQKNHYLILSDEIYGDLHFKGKHRSIAEWYPEGTIVSTGLSKWCGAGGWRLGVMLFPEEQHALAKNVTTLLSHTTSGTSAPIQHAAVRAYQGGPEIEAYRTHSRHIMSALGAYTAHTLSKSGIDVINPDGAFYAFPDFGAYRETLSARGIHTSNNLTQHLLEKEGIALLPGSDFGRPSEELTARIAYVDFDGAAALRAAEKGLPIDQSFIDQYCSRTVEGIRRLYEWVKKK